MNSNVIAMKIAGQSLFFRGVELEAQPPMKLGKKCLRVPPLLEEEELQSCLFSALS